MINGSFLLFPTKGKSEEEIQKRIEELSKLAKYKDNIFYTVFSDASTEDDYNNMMVLYAMNCKDVVVGKEYKDDMMCRIAFDIVLNREDEHQFVFE